MKKIVYKLSTTVFVVLLIIGLVGVTDVYAVPATAPPLGSAASFSVLAALSMSSASTTTISADLGLSPGLQSSKTGVWIHSGGSDYFGTGGLSASAETSALNAYNNLVGQSSGGLWSTNPNGINSPLPGVWNETSSPVYSGTLTLTGTASDIWVFQISTDFTFSGSVVMAGGASACNVYWAVARDMTIGAGSTFAGTVIASRNITSASGSTTTGRLISLNGSLSMNGTSSSVSGCATGTFPPAGPQAATINVVKNVINDNGGTATVASFPLFVNGTPVISGATNAFQAPGPAYTITETGNVNYAQTFSGDCDIFGRIALNAGDNSVCIITNNDIGPTIVVPPIPPIIDVLKVPNPLALPNGPGQVLYSYILRNIGTVPVTNLTMVGDTCRPIVLNSGDTNNNAILEVSETWTYTCTQMLAATHTNTVVATGVANGITATDIASSTVIVGQPTVPPLIHITKVPSALTLFDGGGLVTYTKKVTNPGTVPLSNVRITDDNCSPVSYVSGDINVNSMLDPTETWTYTCSKNLTRTTTNTAVATGDANGLTARDFALATVVVTGVNAGLPFAGIAPDGNNKIPWNLILSAVLLLVIPSVYFVARRKFVIKIV